jgi:hypothetical protein
MFKKYTVADWMEDQGIPFTADAERYIVGQDLTYEQACDIIRMIRQGMGFIGEHPGKNESWTRCGDPYRQVIFQYAQLIEARKKRGSNWDRMLWIALDEEDQIACNDVSNDYFAYKFTMTKRLKEIFERVPKGCKVPKRKYGWF